jgi:hypothetical protein
MISLNLGYPPIIASTPPIREGGPRTMFVVAYPPPRFVSLPVIGPAARLLSERDSLGAPRPEIGAIQFRHERTIDGVAYYA